VSDGLLYGNAAQLGDQALAVLAAPAYAFGATFALLKLIGLFSPLRVTEREEAMGLDIVSHGEEAYATGEGAILVEPIGTSASERAVAQPAMASATSS
jgi:Amt family ammonium transporter